MGSKATPLFSSRVCKRLVIVNQFQRFLCYDKKGAFVNQCWTGQHPNLYISTDLLSIIKLVLVVSLSHPDLPELLAQMH